MIELLKSALIGIIQGITEWLPVSSTGHIILANAVFPLNVSADFFSMFSVVIQFGSILAVLVLYIKRLWPFCLKEGKPAFNGQKITLWLKIAVACVPCALIGFFLDDWLESLLYHDEMTVTTVGAMVIAGALIVYGVIFILLEKRKDANTSKTAVAEDITYRQAIGIGAFQCLALIPGTSRSGSTIMGATILGVSRTAAAEFSFFLAVPVMLGASALKLLKYFIKGIALSSSELLILLVGCAVAFLVSLGVIRFLVDFVRRHSFAPFGWYRIALGAVVILYFSLR